jgi:hypothetical protein
MGHEVNPVSARKVWTNTPATCPLSQRSLPAGRWGRLKLPGHFLPDLLAGRKWGEASALGSQMFAIEIRIEWNEIEILALSPEFDEIGEGETAPIYDAWFERLEDDHVRFLRFERVQCCGTLGCTGPLP